MFLSLGLLGEPSCSQVDMMRDMVRGGRPRGRTRHENCGDAEALWSEGEFGRFDMKNSPLLDCLELRGPQPTEIKLPSA